MHTNLLYFVVCGIQQSTIDVLISQIDGPMKVGDIINIAIDGNTMPPGIIDSNEICSMYSKSVIVLHYNLTAKIRNCTFTTKHFCSASLVETKKNIRTNLPSNPCGLSS